jgi:hypothetical protein
MCSSGSDGCIAGLPHSSAIAQDKPALASWVAWLDAAAQQAQADEERAIKKCPPVELGADKSVTLTRLSTRSVGAGRHSR